MLRVKVHRVLDIVIIRCHGTITLGENFWALRNATASQSAARLVVLDLAGTRRIDAAGLGLLLALRERACADGSQFKLMNVRPKVKRLIRIARLEQVFEFCSVLDMLNLVHVARSAALAARCGFPKPTAAALYDPPTA